jgi:hypothetical protein
MKTYTVLFAQDVPHYGSIDIEADDDAAAIALASAFDLDDVTLDPDWDNTSCRRIVHIEAPDGRLIAEAVALDNSFLRYGGDEDRRLCDAAPQLLEALKTIAAIPLWGESIPPGDERDAYAEHAEYDIEHDSFEPSCDTESTLLRDAVETARHTLAALEGRGS